jgi:hypothetical protein
VYTFNATGTFVLVAADLVFVLLTGRLRLAANYDSRDTPQFSARDLRTGRVAGSLMAGAVLALLIVGALSIGPGHIIRVGLDWYAVNHDKVSALLTYIWYGVLIVAATVAVGHAAWRRDWGRALEWSWAVLGLWSAAIGLGGGLALIGSHRWWGYLWFLGGVVVTTAFGVQWAKAGEAADRKHKRQDRAEHARLRREQRAAEWRDQLLTAAMARPGDEIVLTAANVGMLMNIRADAARRRLRLLEAYGMAQRADDDPRPGHAHRWRILPPGQ